MTGRNDPCPCGSGKKAKKCCGGAKKEHKFHVPAKDGEIKKIPLPVFHRMIAPQGKKAEEKESEEKS